MPRTSMPRIPPGSSPRAHRKSNRSNREARVLACSNCRARKTKCDGGRPGCKTCEVYHDQCRYDKAPSLSQVAAMSQKIQDYESLIERLQRQATTSQSVEDPVASTHVDAVIPSPPLAGRRGDLQATDIQESELSDRLPFDIGVDEHGQVCYHGPTSAIHDPASGQCLQLEPSISSDSHAHLEARTQLTAVAIESRTWEHFALGNAALRTGVPKEVLSELLKLHWSWIAPMFMWVYRPAFMRDMATGGQYCSEFLLTVLCAHSSRFCDQRVGASLMSRAKLLLGSEVQKPSAIATVQALLQLSARDLAFGSISQAWLYSGMAFRMSSDLGLHHNGGTSTGTIPGTAVEDIEIRRRLFWSCYFWDKSISLYLGRMPTLTDLPSECNIVLLDESAEYESWVPYYEPSNMMGRPKTAEYPSMKSHAISCFQNSCKLSIILNEIMHLLYSRRRTEDMETAVRATSVRLDQWRSETPDHLKYDPNKLPAICGPPHILTQNLLYHTTRILLHRPFSSKPEHRAACRDAANSIEALVKHFEATFGFTHMTYLMAYCVYTGASTTVQDVRDGDPCAWEKIETYIRALKGSCKTCPGLRRSLEIIQNSLQTATRDDLGASITGQEQPPNFLPAFPRYVEHSNATVNRNEEEMYNLDSFAMLECFPEEHFEQMDSGWYLASPNFG